MGVLESWELPQSHPISISTLCPESSGLNQGKEASRRVKEKASLTHGLPTREEKGARVPETTMTKEPRRQRTNDPRTSGNFTCLQGPSWKRGLPGVSRPAQATTGDRTGCLAEEAAQLRSGSGPAAGQQGFCSVSNQKEEAALETRSIREARPGLVSLCFS